MRRLGYCTNVHAGPDLERTRQNLRTHAEDVKRRFSPEQPMGVGLWLAAPAARALRQSGAAGRLADELAAAGLTPFTFNGFPYGDFHQEVVKHDVYHPTWMEPSRLEYTLDLIAIQHALLPPGETGSISTLPVAWGDVRQDQAALAAAGRQLARAGEAMAELERDTGRRLCLCLEPEPGCVMDRSEHVVDFFQRHLLPAGDEAVLRRHIQVCHDVCHAAVMFEPQAEALDAYRRAGIGVGKVQVSSAVALPLDELEEERRRAALRQLAEFNEPRYLHQTTHRDRDGRVRFYEDLAPALDRLSADERPQGELRVHFHVPIYLEQFGDLRTTHEEIRQCVAQAPTDHYEVETYAWSVLPEELQQPSLAAGIAEELRWFQQLLPPAGGGS